MRFWVPWGVAAVVVLIAAALQVRHALDAAACQSQDLLMLCSGPLDRWVLPATVLAAGALVVLAITRVRRRLPIASAGS